MEKQILAQYETVLNRMHWFMKYDFEQHKDFFLQYKCKKPVQHPKWSFLQNC